jgi:hypothetical protein
VSLRTRAADDGEWDRPAGTSEHTDRASDLLRRERENECCCRNRSGLLQRESEWCRKDKTDEITTCVSDVRKKATLGGNQRRRILQACVGSTKLSVMDFIACYQYDRDQ